MGPAAFPRRTGDGKGSQKEESGAQEKGGKESFSQGAQANGGEEDRAREGQAQEEGREGRDAGRQPWHREARGA